MLVDTVHEETMERDKERIVYSAIMDKQKYYIPKTKTEWLKIFTVLFFHAHAHTLHCGLTDSCPPVYSALQVGCPAEIGNRQLVDVAM